MNISCSTKNKQLTFAFMCVLIQPAFKAMSSECMIRSSHNCIFRVRFITVSTDRSFDMLDYANVYTG